MVNISTITYQTDDRVKYLLNNLASEQNEDPQISHLKLSTLSSRYTIKNTILYKLVNDDWKILLSPEMLKTLTRPCHQSLAHASALKCHLALREDSILNNMFRRIKAILKGFYECQTARHPNLHTYVDLSLIHI